MTTKICLPVILCLATSCGMFAPSEVEVGAGHTEIDHDEDIFDGQSNSGWVALHWPLGMQREAFEAQVRQRDDTERLLRAQEAQARDLEKLLHVQETAAAVATVGAGISAKEAGAETTSDGGFDIGPVHIPGAMMDATVVGGMPLFVWWAIAVLILGGAAFVFMKAKRRWNQRKQTLKKKTEVPEKLEK